MLSLRSIVSLSCLCSGFMHPYAIMACRLASLSQDLSREREAQRRAHDHMSSMLDEVENSKSDDGSSSSDEDDAPARRPTRRGAHCQPLAVPDAVLTFARRLPCGRPSDTAPIVVADAHWSCT